MPWLWPEKLRKFAKKGFSTGPPPLPPFPRTGSEVHFVRRICCASHCTCFSAFTTSTFTARHEELTALLDALIERGAIDDAGKAAVLGTPRVLSELTQDPVDAVGLFRAAERALPDRLRPQDALFFTNTVGVLM